MGRLTTVILGAAVTLASCNTIGPATIPRDRFDYSRALGDSWKRQTLLNIVKLRYMDLPMFLEVGQIVSGYSLETSISAGGQLSSATAIQGDSATLGAAARFTDRPTITYRPMTGDSYLRNMLEPIRPRTLFALIQAGYGASALMELTVQSFNGLRNRAQGRNRRQADPEFLRAIDLMEDIQASGAIGLSLERQSDVDPTSVVFFRKVGIDPDIVAMGTELRSLLGLPLDAPRFDLIYSPVQGEPSQLAVQTRSLLQILLALSSFVEIPESDVTAGRAVPTPPLAPGRPPLLRILSSESEPDDAYFTVYYRDRWFWVNDADWHSKAVFAFVMFIFTLGESQTDAAAPVLTIPTS